MHHVCRIIYDGVEQKRLVHRFVDKGIQKFSICLLNQILSGVGGYHADDGGFIQGHLQLDFQSCASSPFIPGIFPIHQHQIVSAMQQYDRASRRPRHLPPDEAVIASI